MTNLAITAKCNQRCGYCFSLDTLAGVSPAALHMSCEMFGQALDFLQRSGIDQVRLLGGEPTLHPKFVTLVTTALERGFSLLVFSNGLIGARALRALQAVPTDRLTVLLNTSTGQTPDRANRLHRVLEALGGHIELGCNIHTPAPDLDPLLQLIETYGLTRRVRLGIAQPGIAAQNDYLRHPHFRRVGSAVAGFFSRARASGIDIDFDCGFVPCMFSMRELETLGVAGADIGKRCNPIPDLLPDGSLVPCFPLAPLGSLHLEDYPDADTLRTAFETRLKPYRHAGIYRECTACPAWEQDRCGGGCLSVAIRRFRHADKGEHARAETLDSGKAGRRAIHKWIVPYIDQPASFWRQIAADHPGRIEEIYFPLPGTSASGRPRQPERHLEEFLTLSPLPAAALINPIVLSAPIEQCAPAILEALRRLQGDFGVMRVTVASLELAERIRAALPEFRITASVLMDVFRPHQASLLNGVCDNLVPSSRVMRDLTALKELRSAFKGRVRLLVNEGCLPDCLFRVQHFFEMATDNAHPCSLCGDLLKREPWLRMTGAWVLPQHLHQFQELADDMKLAGRVTLQNPVDYRRTLDAYVNGTELTPEQIGGGPAAMTQALEITEKFYTSTLICGHRCDSCTLCRDYFEQAAHRESGA